MARVTIDQGKLRGGISTTDNGFEYFEFLGVPYAKPPVGSLRFKSPLSPEPWDGERDATNIDQTKIACQMMEDKFVGSEDCLYLNVYSPKLPTSSIPSTELPVMVFIHGGGFIAKSGIMKNETGPDYLIEHNVVLVTINYRLNVFGFLSLCIPEAKGNMGLKDQVKALQWIKNNITKFGGDKDSVTVFGMSAGAASIEYLILSPLAKGLFHKAIIQSGSSLNHWAINYNPKPLVLKLLKQLNYKGSTQNTQIYDYLFTIPASVLTVAVFQTFGDYTYNRIYYGFVPTIEKDFGNGDAIITSNPYELLKEGKFNDVPVIRGFCNGEGILTYITEPHIFKRHIESSNFADNFLCTLTEIDTSINSTTISTAYMKNMKPEDNDQIMLDFFGDLDFVAGIWIAGKLLARKRTPTFCYQFSYNGELNFMKKVFGITKKRASHFDDYTYLLCHDLGRTANKNDAKLRKVMTTMWTNFAKTSDPTPVISDIIPMKWSAFTEDSFVYLNIDEKLTILSDYEPQKMLLFEEMYETYNVLDENLGTTSRPCEEPLTESKPVIDFQLKIETVSLRHGKLRGLKSETENGFELYEFMGIPYAKPPVGNLRFKSPQPLEPWEGEWDATAINKNNIACQFDAVVGNGQVLGSEDCLYLNVYTPKLPLPESKPSPVIFFIHGGGFIRGSGIAKNEVVPDFLIEHDLVIVTINYRLSIFGFLSLDIPEAAGNMGLKDQVKALEWVQNNINEFGGDKNNVTIIGVSAGAAAAELLVLSPLAKGLFHKAILHSGGSLNHWAVNYEPKTLVFKLLKHLDYKGSIDDSYAINEFLSEIPASTLIVAAYQTLDKFTSKRIYFGFCPTIEKDFGNGDAILTSNPYKLLKEGNFNHVPIIRGYSNGEGLQMHHFKASGVKDLRKSKNYVDHFAFNMDANDANEYNEKFLNLYVDTDSGDGNDFAVDFFTDLDFSAGSRIAGKMQANRSVPVYNFMFTYDGQSFFKNMFNFKFKGATHCDELSYIMPLTAIKLESQADIKMKIWLTKMWANFSRTSNPTPDDDPIHWPAYCEEKPVYLNIDKQLKIERHYEPRKLSVFEEIYNKYEK